MKQQIIERLMALPEEIASAEKALIDAQRAVEVAKSELVDREAALINGKVDDIKIDGKNAEQRQAQLREATKFQRDAVAICEHDLQVAKVRLNSLTNQFRALRSAAMLLSGEVA